MQKPDYKGHLDMYSLAIPKAWEMQKEFCFPVSKPFNGLGLVSKQRFPREPYFEAQALGSATL